MHRILLGVCTLLIGLGFVGIAVAQEADKPVERASIPFADLGGIRDFRAESDSVLYVQGNHRKWYRVEFFGPCFGLRSSETLAFVTSHDGSLDRFSSVLVRGDRCYFRSFEAVDEPPFAKKDEAEKSDEASAN